jgi:ATP-dependent DNA ligase
MSLPLQVDLPPMEAAPVDVLPDGPGWQFEPKWDGFRCLVFRDGDSVDLRSKSGQPLARYFPDLAAAAAALSAPRFVLDGEIVIAVDGVLSFEELQLRLHPAASRVRKLAAAHPARLIAFDLLVNADGADLSRQPLALRRAALERFAGDRFTDGGPFTLSPASTDIEAARAWFADIGGGLDGVMAKRRDAAYRSGERDGMVKYKVLRSADCVVGGFRYGSNSDLVGSLLLGLYDADGRLDHVGFTATLARAERPALTRRLEALIEPPGFSGRAPGGPSRWSNGRSADWRPLRPELVVEVRYDHVSGGRFRHGTKLLRWRPDKAPGQCRYDQLGRAAAAVMELA